ncbi:MAG: type IV secretion system protein [Candidatus Omnitrophica bacterium]|nr:type IV secretion system protein [Candidatus Omnitrophota bacterium]
MNKTSADPYVRARKEFDEVFHNLSASRHNWMMLAFACALIAILAIGCCFYAIGRSHVIPYVVEVDNLGRSMAVSEAKEEPLNDEKVIRAFVYQYLDMARSVVSDPKAITKNVREVYKQSIRSVQTNFLDDYYKQNNPFDYAQKTGTRYLEPIVFLKESENTYSVEWREIESNYQNQVLSDSHYKALISVVQVPHTSAYQYQDDPLNPFGLYVTSISWSKLM